LGGKGEGWKEERMGENGRMGKDWGIRGDLERKRENSWNEIGN
jgi:hypothetical protein